MTVVLMVALAVAQAAPIGSALSDGIELVYESRGVAQAPWVYDSVRVVERQDFDRCVVTGRRSQPARESCVRGDTLFERSASDGYRAVRPLGPNMQLDVHTAAGDILHYTTREAGIERIAGGLEVVSLVTTIITRNASGTVTRRLRERYAPALLSAVWGVFEEPDESGGWRSGMEFSLIDVSMLSRDAGGRTAGSAAADSRTANSVCTVPASAECAGCSAADDHDRHAGLVREAVRRNRTGVRSVDSGEGTQRCPRTLHGRLQSRRRRSDRSASHGRKRLHARRAPLRFGPGLDPAAHAGKPVPRARWISI
jgi:hypothetical protein